MEKYFYNEQYTEPYDTIEAMFEFTDVDGNQVAGKYSRSSLLGLVEALGDIMLQEFHPTANKPESWTNGIIDTLQPINITIKKITG